MLVIQSHFASNASFIYNSTNNNSAFSLVDTDLNPLKPRGKHTLLITPGRQDKTNGQHTFLSAL